MLEIFEDLHKVLKKSLNTVNIFASYSLWWTTKNLYIEILEYLQSFKD